MDTSALLAVLFGEDALIAALEMRVVAFGPEHPEGDDFTRTDAPRVRCRPHR